MAGIVDKICAEAGIGLRLIPKDRWPGDNEARCRGTMKRVVEKHGAGHLRLVLTCIRGSKINRQAVQAEYVEAVSRVLAARGDLREANGLAEAFDVIDLPRLGAKAKAMRAASRRSNLFTLLEDELAKRLEAQIGLDI